MDWQVPADIRIAYRLNGVTVPVTSSMPLPVTSTGMQPGIEASHNELLAAILDELKLVRLEIAMLQGSFSDPN